MRILIVTGTFDESGGRSSKIGNQFVSGFRSRTNTTSVTSINGGTISLLETLIKNDIKHYSAVVWFPNISNNYEQKLVSTIKKINKTCTLVTSKRNIDNKYTLSELINRALKTKANLFVEINKHGGLYTGRVLDPLGNCFMNSTSDFSTIGSNIALWISELRKFTRLPSIEWDCDLPPVPDEEDFLV